MTKRTVLYPHHRKANAKLIDFAGWEMPVNYGSQIEEHKAVRNDAGMFDVSHMMVTEVKGEDAEIFLRYLLANDVAKLMIGRAQYGCMLNEEGGVIDDLITYKLADDWFRLVTNAGTRDKVQVWIEKQAKAFNVTVTTNNDVAIIAVQGPNAIKRLVEIVPELADIESLKSFHLLMHHDWQIARTGYTGEDGVEIILPNKDAKALWQALTDAGIQACGLGARDTLRLEAGLNLYGHDMDETTNPYEAKLGWTVAMQPEERDFIGKKALLAIKQNGASQKLVGVVLTGRGVLREQQAVMFAEQQGVLTSGSFSPTLGKSIGLARVPKAVKVDDVGEVTIRNKQLAIKVVKTPFLKRN